MSDAIDQLRHAIDNHQSAIAAATLDADVEVVLAVRKAITDAIENSDWSKYPSGGLDETQYAELRSCLKEAHNCIELGRHEFSERYRESITNKIQILETLKSPVQELMDRLFAG